MSVRKKLASNAAYLFLDWIIGTVLSTIFWTIVSKTFLPEISGIISTATNLAVTIASITLVGFSDAANKLIPEYIARNQKHKVIGLIHYAIEAASIISFIVSLVFFVFSQQLTAVFNIPASSIQLVSFFLVAHSLFFLTGAIARGFQEMKRFTLSNIAGYVGKITMLVVFLQFGFNYIGAAAAYFLSIFFIVVLRMRYAFVGSKPTPVDRKGITLNYAFPAFVTTISATVIKNGQYIMLTMIRSAQATGLFNIAMLISSPIQVLPSILSLAIGPILSALSVGRNKKLQASLMGSVFRYVMFVSLLFSILVIMFSKNLIFLFSRKEYLPATVLFPFICLATVFLSAGDVFNTCLYSTGKAKIQRNIILATLAVFLMVSVPLTYLFSATGMAISYAISMFMLSYLSYYYANKFIRVKLDFKPLFKLIASSAAMAIFLYLTSTFVYGLLSVAVFGLIGTAIYLLALIPLKFYNEEDVKVIRFLGEKVPALQRPMNKIADLLSRFV